MLSRVITVIWWLGLLIASLGTVADITGALTRESCAAAFKLDQEIKAAQAEAERYKRDHPTTAGGSVSLKELLHPVPRDPRDTPELREKVTDCWYFPTGHISIAVGWSLALMLWALAYVLGGSFWRPPKRRT
ncbi:MULTISPECIES: hypothetical protein [unclassified Variovorax]|uniref:hypothetical protein n=1 Tax=unclassified Variovorax TaxID=663243 RepID=UPI000837CFE7|nr:MULTISPECIES: hypothetical protein [unclassified Variovorax]PNG56039.1 hypothetical protein CHC07_02453 [Variovorax sp. B4]PNG57463.1 hypothetical protein CHC06_02456 [Variovorax sp. B2]VTV10159.1 hypothetical protein WDL1CHR_01174 [Variovorax sp. WDL1]